MTRLPEGWAETDLGTIAAFVMGQAPPGTASNFDAVGTPFVKAGEFGDVRPVIREWTTMPLKMAEEGDVLICVVGATSGKINLGANCAIGRSVAAIRPSEAIDQFYLHSFMKTQVEGLRRGSTGTAQGVISSAMLYSVPVRLAPLPEQKRIVAKVGGLTARTARARADLDRIPTLIARYKQRLLALAFSGELTAGWRLENPSLVQVARKTVGDLLTDIVGGKNLRCVERPPNENEQGVVKVSAVTWGRFDPQASKTLPANFAPPEKTRIRKGDILISRANTLKLVAAVVIVDEAPSNLFLSDKVLRLEMRDQDKPWLMWFLRSPDGRSQIEASATGNQLSMRNLSQSGLRGIELPWPSYPERAEIVRRIESAFNWLDRMAADHAAAAKLLPKLDAAILAKAFRGELVLQDPSDEPATALLERIKAQQLETPKKGRERKSGFRPDGEHLVYTPPTIPRPAKESTMTKSRQDDDVMGKPYLASILKEQRGAATPNDLYALSDLQLHEFYHQLAQEYDKGWLRDAGGKVEAV